MLSIIYKLNLSTVGKKTLRWSSSINLTFFINEAPDSMWDIIAPTSAHAPVWQYTACSLIIKSKFVQHGQRPSQGAGQFCCDCVCATTGFLLARSDTIVWIKTDSSLLGFSLRRSEQTGHCVCHKHTQRLLYPDADSLTEALYSLRNSEFLVDRPVGHLPLLEVGTHTHQNQPRDFTAPCQQWQ